MGPPQVIATLAVAILVTVVIGLVFVLRGRRGRRDAVERDAADEELRRQVLEHLAIQVAEWDNGVGLAPLGGAAAADTPDDPAPPTPPRAARVTRDGAAHVRPGSWWAPRVAGGLVLVLGLVVVAAASASWLTSR